MSEPEPEEELCEDITHVTFYCLDFGSQICDAVAGPIAMRHCLYTIPIEKLVYTGHPRLAEYDALLLPNLFCPVCEKPLKHLIYRKYYEGRIKPIQFWRCWIDEPGQ